LNALSPGTNFFHQGLWGENFCPSGLCDVADMNNDGRDDVVDFGPTDYCSEYAGEPVPGDPERVRGCALHPLTRVRIALSGGLGFDPPVESQPSGGGAGWTRTSHEMDCRSVDSGYPSRPCLVGDVNGDGYADVVDVVVGSNAQPELVRRPGNVYVSLNTGIWVPWELQ
jgi:hypothetical protein